MAKYTFPNPNGGSMSIDASNAADARAKASQAGWTPSMGSFGDNTGADWTATNGGTSRGSGGGGSGYNAPPASLSGNDQAILDAFRQSSGFSLQELAEKKRQFDQQLEWQKQMWAQQGLPQLVIQQRAQDLAEKEYATQKALIEANLTGSYNGQQTEAAREYAQNLALQQRQQAFNERLQQGNQELQRGNLGMDYLKTAASMGGPADYFQLDDFERGAAQRGDVPVFLQALRNNTQLGTGAVAGTPTPQSAGGLAARLDGSGASGAAPSTGTNSGSALNAIGDVLRRGGSGLGPQAIEQLNPDELGLLQSGAKKLGYSLPAFLQNYQQSRIGQGASQAA